MISSAGDDMEKTKTSYTASNNINYLNHAEEQFGKIS